MNKKHSACSGMPPCIFVKPTLPPWLLKSQSPLFPKIGRAQTSGPSPCSRRLEQDAVGWEHPILFARSWLWGFGKAAGKDV